MNKWFKNMIADEDGQGMVEYGLLVGLIAIFVIGALVFLGPKIAEMFTGAGEQLSSANETYAVPAG